MIVQLPVILTGVNGKAGCHSKWMQSLPMSKQRAKTDRSLITTVLIELTWEDHDGGYPNLLLMTNERHIPCSQHGLHSEQMELTCTKQILWGFYLSRRQIQQKSALLQKTVKTLPKKMSLNFPNDLKCLWGVPAKADELCSSPSLRTSWYTTTCHMAVSQRDYLSSLIVRYWRHVENSYQTSCVAIRGWAGD